LSEEKTSNRGHNVQKGVQGFISTGSKKTNDMTLDQIRGKKAYQYQMRSAQRGMKFNPNASMKSQLNSFASDFLPHQPTKTEEDFANYYMPSEDVFSTSGSGTDLSWGFSEFRYLAEKRIGLGPKLTRMPSDDAVRNRFKFLNLKTNKVEEKDEILDYLEKTDFFNQLAEAIYFERVYGCGFLVKYYTDNDKNVDLSKSPYEKGKTREPVAFRAFSPLQMWPTNYQDFPRDPQKWKVRGGNRYGQGSQEIHEDRVHVFISRPVEYRWWGLSIFEPIWYPIICYFMAQIFTLRAFSRLGNSILTVKLDDSLDLQQLFDKWGDLLEEQRMNGMLITGMGSEVNVLNTEIAVGLRDLMEIWIEDISAGTGIPVVIMLGRSESAGIGSEMYLVFERYYWNMIAKIQQSFGDDVLTILKSAGFKLQGYRLDWALAIVKTDAQRLADENMALQNEALEKQNQLLDMQMQAEELELAIREDQFINGETTEEGNGGGEKPKQDFVDEGNKRRTKIVLDLHKKWEGAKV
jgi:hypothetical protein